MTTYKLTAIVSGGQAGVDRGALQAAIDLGLGWGGWAPAGLRAEDGVIPEIYAARMRCTSSDDYGMRTRLNVQDSDGTLLVSFEEQLTGGSLFTERTAARTKKPYLHLVLPDRGKAQLPDEVRAGILEWVSDCRISVLNVAGPRESKAPGIQEAVRDVLVWIFEPEAKDDAPPTTPEELATAKAIGHELAELGFGPGVASGAALAELDLPRTRAGALQALVDANADPDIPRDVVEQIAADGTFTIPVAEFNRKMAAGEVRFEHETLPLGKSHEEMAAARAIAAAEPVIVADAAERVLAAEDLPPFDDQIEALLDPPDPEVTP